MPYGRLVVTLAFLPVSLGICHGSAVAQVTAQVRGRILDAESGMGISMSWLQLTDNGARVGADSAGTFRLALPLGIYRIVFHGFGYASEEQVIDIRSDTVLTISLRHQPLVLVGIEVNAERLAARARALPWSVRRVTREELVSSPAATPLDALERRSLQLIPCQEGECVRWRGSLIAPLVCIDELRAVAGLAELENVPFASLHSIEVHDRGRMIRAYTTWFMEQLHKGRISLRPALRTDAPQC